MPKRESGRSHCPISNGPANHTDFAQAHDNLGNALLQAGRLDEAMVQYRTALQIRPGNAKAYNNLGNVLLEKGKVDEAIVQYQTALEIDPGYPEGHNSFGYALIQKGRMDEAIAQFQAAIEGKPDYVEPQNNLAWLLATTAQATLRNGNRAVELAQRANQLTGGKNPVILRTLAAAYAEAGQFDDARQSAQTAFKLAQAAGHPDLAKQVNDELKLYAAGIPFHEKGK